MIETFKIMTGVYDPEVCHGIFMLQENGRTRGHPMKIVKKLSKLHKRRTHFAIRM